MFPQQKRKCGAGTRTEQQHRWERCTDRKREKGARAPRRPGEGHDRVQILRKGPERSALEWPLHRAAPGEGYRAGTGEHKAGPNHVFQRQDAGKGQSGRAHRNQCSGRMDRSAEQVCKTRRILCFGVKRGEARDRAAQFGLCCGWGLNAFGLGRTLGNRHGALHR